jgi:D-aminopeptidase
MAKPRARELGLAFPGTPGPLNAITDVPGVLVGCETVIAEAAPTGPGGRGHGPIRSGVTAILPRGFEAEPMPLWAGLFAFNGNGEMTGSHWIKDAGYFFGPICITNTHSVGMVHHGASRWMIDHYAEAFAREHLWALPVVAETYDGLLNDINAQFVTAAHALAALAKANGGLPPEGNCGGGTGMVTYEFKGGTGTASRLVEAAGETYRLSALVQANHGRRDHLSILGVPLGEAMAEHRLWGRETGSIIAIIACDAPLAPLTLHHLAKRATIGIGRHGTPGGNSSGDIFLAFSTANAQPLAAQAPPLLDLKFFNEDFFDPFYQATVEAVEEAVVNAMVAAEDMVSVKPPGLLCKAIDTEALCDILARHGKIKTT